MTKDLQLIRLALLEQGKCVGQLRESLSIIQGEIDRLADSVRAQEDAIRRMCRHVGVEIGDAGESDE